MTEINTPNILFNNAWKLLKTYHQETEAFPDTIALDFRNIPRFKNSSDWLHYFAAVYELLVVGYRNGWIRTHVDGRGFPVFILIDRNYFKQV
ncbi:MAG: hypothetical protein Q8P40_04330 [Nitrospirota bacterium]|nr:hypothetical protein [Nitrospirota bacterium]